MTRTTTLKGRHVLLIFLAFFITVTGVNALMVTYAIKTFSGEDVSAAYVKGLNYNAALTARDVEARSGYAVAAGAVRAGDVTNVTATVTHQGGPARDVAVTATLRHPTNAHLDRSAPLVDGGAGVFTAPFSGLPAGRWDLVIAVQKGGDTLYEARTRLWLR